MAAMLPLLVSGQDWKDKPVLDTSKSPSAVLHGVPVSAVTMGEGFWSPRRKINVEASLPSLLEQFESRGIMDNFRRVSGRKDVARRGPLYTDSDVYKWLEAVAYVLQSGDNPALRKPAEAVIDDIVAAQEPSGYLNTYYAKEHLAQRHTNMVGGHELYCLGHLVQAGIAWYRATGDRKLLDSGIKMVEYIIREFGPGKKPIFEGHPEFELSLVELYRTTGDKRYLDLTYYFLNGDPRNLEGRRKRDLVYLFTITPITERDKLEGHAVRAMYASSGAADYYLETGDQKYRATLDTLWNDMAKRKMYITGGVGSRAAGEAFGEPYELPNQQAYTESCAAIGTMFFNWRMLQATGDSRYTDLFERSLYNGANSGLSLDGRLYCYRNPLELVGNKEDRIRNEWYDTTCCPPNLQRTMASLPGYFYSTSKQGLWVHLYDNNTLKWKLEDGTPLEVKQATAYPWDGKVELTVNPGSAREFTLFLRKPSWSPAAKVAVNGAPAAPQAQKGYLMLTRTWKPGDKVVLTLEMTPRLVASNPRVRENIGRVAVERGPVLYCMEGLDQPAGASLFDWTLDGPLSAFRVEKSDKLGGITVLKHAATRPAKALDGDPLYDTLRQKGGAGDIKGEATLIPYYTFHNRDITTMQVWIPYR